MCLRRWGVRNACSSVFGHGLGAASLPQHLHDVTVEGAFCVIEGFLAILVGCVDLRSTVNEHLHTLQLLLHGCPHECCLTTLGVCLQRAFLLDKNFAKEGVAGLHGSEEPRLPVRVLVVGLGTLCNEVLAHFISSKLSCKQNRRLPDFGDKVHLRILRYQALHGSKVTLCCSPHERSLVFIVKLVH